MRKIEPILERFASLRDFMPNNPILGELAGCSRSSVLRTLYRLVAAHVIAIEHVGNRRSVTILATGKSSDWGEARPGHMARQLHPSYQVIGASA